MPRPSLLVVTAAPDDRPSTDTLRDVVAELRRRDLRVHLWFLRDGGRKPSDADRIVDHLREQDPAATLDHVGLRRLAGAVRGRQLRRWWAEDRPDWVLLDDGLGARLLDGTRAPVRRIVRTNATVPDDVGLEPPPSTSADLLLAGEGSDTSRTTAPSTLDMPLLRDHVAGHVARDGASRAATRTALGLDGAAPLVVGWGDDPWLDGPDLLIRSLWALERHHGIEACGLWLGIDPDSEAGRRLTDEAQRCGVADRLVLDRDDSAAQRLCGDAVFLPYRSPGDVEPVHEALVAGCGVVTFPVWPAEDRAVRVVGHLDVDAAADALAEVLGDDREAVAARAEQRYDVVPWVDRFLTVLAEFG